MKYVWVLHVYRGYDYESDFAGVWDEVSLDTLSFIGHEDTFWKFHKDSICGHNMAWETKATEFLFERIPVGMYNKPAQYA